MPEVQATPSRHLPTTGYRREHGGESVFKLEVPANPDFPEADFWPEMFSRVTARVEQIFWLDLRLHLELSYLCATRIRKRNIWR